MTKHLLAVVLMACAGAASACPLTDALVSRYGITFSGFDKPIPESAEPRTDKGSALMRFTVPDRTNVSDGFRHVVLLDAEKKRAWILRTGGFMPVRLWFGPVDVGNVSTEGCRDEYHARAADVAVKQR